MPLSHDGRVTYWSLDCSTNQAFEKFRQRLRSATRNKGMRPDGRTKCAIASAKVSTSRRTSSLAPIGDTQNEALKDVDIMFVLGSKENAAG